MKLIEKICCNKTRTLMKLFVIFTAPRFKRIRVNISDSESEDGPPPISTPPPVSRKPWIDDKGNVHDLKGCMALSTIKNQTSIHKQTHHDSTEDDNSSASMITQCDDTEPEVDNPPLLLSASTNVLLMNSYFDIVYAKALCHVRLLVVRKKCNGCRIDHPSQNQHDCLGNPHEFEQERLDFYFEDMLQAVNEQDILQSWEDLVKITNIPADIIEMHKRVISSKDFLAIMKTEHWCKKMKRLVLTLNNVEECLVRWD